MEVSDGRVHDSTQVQLLPSCSHVRSVLCFKFHHQVRRPEHHPSLTSQVGSVLYADSSIAIPDVAHATIRSVGWCVQVLKRCLDATDDNPALALPMYTNQRAQEAKDLVQLSRQCPLLYFASSVRRHCDGV